MKRQSCELCQAASAFAVIVYKHNEVSSQGISPVKNKSFLRIEKSLSRTHEIAQYVCDSCFKLFVHGQ